MDGPREDADAQCRIRCPGRTAAGRCATRCAAGETSAPRACGDRTAYLFGIARFQLLKFIERKSRSGAPFDSTRLSMAAVGTSLSMHFDRRNRLMGALRELPIEQQIAFELRHGEEMQLEEVAKAMEVSLATIKRYLASAKAALQAHLRAGDDPSGQIADAYRSN